ncbi:hypothetical protein [Candidatus Alkanophaga liquidiphilum]|nr:hypothetical protein [Candidatus Alkanophaga liquidiphilum]RLG37728.1 MAG: hypothetical protein DRN91_04610 [Candidatus Alkanophagales archaeon]
MVDVEEFGFLADIIGNVVKSLTGVNIVLTLEDVTLDLGLIGFTLSGKVKLSIEGEEEEE